MLLFLATIVEQLDLALAHVEKRNAHDARFGLMLIDNAVELVLHQIAKERSSRMKAHAFMRDSYAHQTAMEKALGKSFDAKVKFARIEERLDLETSGTISIMHELRNEVYHTGIQYEEILPNLAIFYLEAAAAYLGTYQPHSLWWSSSQKLPERAKKYFPGDAFMPRSADNFKDGCMAIARACGHDVAETISVLADHLDKIIEDQDTCISVVADGVYEGQQRTRDRAVIETQAWQFAFSQDGKKLAAERGWTGNMLTWVDWLADNHPFNLRRDPVASWRRQATKLRSNSNPHSALKHYYSFMIETASFRETMEESARQAEAEIDMLIDQARGK